MTTFPNAPRLVRGGIVLLDPQSGQPVRVVALQYNPDTLTRTLVPQGIGNEPGDRLEALRLKAPPQETIKVEAELDATDQLEFPDQNPTVAQDGLLPVLATLETLIYPTSAQLLNQDALAQQGMIEIDPVEAPLSVFVWGKSRVLPVRVTEFSVTEEAFDARLNPIRAKVSLGMRVLTVDDLGFSHRGGVLYLLYQQQKERFAGTAPPTSLSALGLSSIPGG
jgi:hypothetical protein